MSYSGGGYPKWLVGEYPGLEGENTALHGFNYLLKDPGFGQLASSVSSDPAGADYQAKTGAGLPASAGAGLFGRLMAGQMGADVAGKSAQDQAQTSANQAKIQTGQNAANLMDSQQQAQLELQRAQGTQAGQQLGGFSSILNMLTDPKGMGANIMQAFGGKGGASPLGGLFSSIMGLGGGAAGGADLLGMGAVDTAGAAGGMESIMALLPLLAA